MRELLNLSVGRIDHLMFIGELAALTAAVFLAVMSTVMTFSGREIGAALANRTALVISMVCIFTLHWLINGQPFPVDATPDRWFWLGISGIIGYLLSFLTVIYSYTLIGPRLGILIASLGPVFSAILAWIFLNEELGVTAILGIAITISGVMLVVLEKGQNGQAKNIQDYRKGILFALAGVVFKATALILSKHGLEGDYNALSGSLIRVSVATVTITLLMLVRGQFLPNLRAVLDHPRAIKFLVVGAVAGPTLGALLLLVAIQNTEVGIASTLNSLSPIFLIPIGYVVFKEQITIRAVIGTFIAIAGTAILFLL